MAGRYKVELTRGAEKDLETLYAYIAEHRSAEQAAELLDALLERIATLESYPERGSVPSEIEQLGITDFRQLLLTPYRLIYRVVGSTVFILVIADGRRDMQGLLEQRLFAR